MQHAQEPQYAYGRVQVCMVTTSEHARWPKRVWKKGNHRNEHSTLVLVHLLLHLDSDLNRTRSRMVLLGRSNVGREVLQLLVSLRC